MLECRQSGVLARVLPVQAARWGAFGAVELWDVDGRVCDAVEYADDGEGCVPQSLCMAGADTRVVWAATTKNKDYIQMVGMKHVVNNMEHRKEFVTGNLAEFMTRGAPLDRF